MKTLKHIPPTPFKGGFFTSLLALCLSMGISQNANADLKDGLVAHWSFDDCRATDNSGNGHDGTLVGNPQCVDGVKGKAFSFDGVKDFIQVNDESMDFSPNDLTVSVWINPNSTQLDFAGIIDKSHSSGSVGGWVLQGTNNNKPSFYFGYCNTTGQCSAKYGEDLHASTAANNWTHVVFTKKGNATTGYQNGKIISTMQGSFSDYPKTNKPLLIGAVNSWDRYFNGLIDDASIYNRALTEAEVMELYNGVEKTKETVQISGQIKLGSQAGKGVSLLGDGLAESCLTDANGKFNCKITKGLTGFLTPESKGVSFSPPRISVTDAQTNLEVKTPLVGTTTDSFPLNGVMTADWVKLKTDKATWQVETSTGASDDKTAYEGRFSFGSAKIGANQTAAIETTINVTQAGQLSFVRRVSSNPEHGVLNFEISGKQKNGTWKTLVTEKSSGDVAWEMKNYALSVGQFKLRWTYAKDGAEVKGEDKAWIDAVSYPSSVKVAAKTCEGITAGTVKLMTIKNPTCDQLQAYAVWSKAIRSSRLKEAGIYSSKITGIEKDNEWWQNVVSGLGMAAGFISPFNPLSSDVAVERVTDLVFGSLLKESIGVLCSDKVITDPVYSSVCDTGREALFSAVTEGLKRFATSNAISGWAVAPYAIEKSISIGLNLRYAWKADDVAFNLNNTNLADDVLDEYYKGGSNDAALKVMAKKYGAKNTALSTLVDAMAKQKGYYNGWADSLTWSFYGNEYDNEIVVNNIESVKSLNQTMIKNFLKK